MKPFKSDLASHLEAYLSYRKSLGYKDKKLRYGLWVFDQYIAKSPINPKRLSPSFFLDFKKSIKGEPKTINSILSATRGFFDYLVRIDILDENPLKEIPPVRINAFIPFIFSPEDISHMLNALENNIRKDPAYFFKDLTVYMAILLLSQCGLRLREPLSLKISHYCKEDGTIYIEKTKFSKDRLIPLPSQLTSQMENFLNVRNTMISKNQTMYLFPGEAGNMLSTKRIYKAFHQVIKAIGIYQCRQIIGNTVFGAPTPHSLRHSFAINTLKKIRDQGKSPQMALPVLSAYMGHRKYRYTAVYLKVLDAKQYRGLVNFCIHAQKDI